MPRSRTLKVKKGFFTKRGVTVWNRKTDLKGGVYRPLFKVSLLGMRHGFGRRNLEKLSSLRELIRVSVRTEHLSTFKKLYKKSLFTKSGVYSCLAFFSFGMMGVVSFAPELPKETPLVQIDTVNTVQKPVENSVERCYWQEDVTQFLTLQEKKKGVSRTQVPCKENFTVETPLVKKQNAPDTELGATLRGLTDGYPIAVMAPMIAQYDRDIAGLIVGIAKKESNWGKRVPVDGNGADCFNYWGYKGAGTRGVAMGHACFGSPEEAVTTVGDRLKVLVDLRKTSAPANMIVWKCGSTCKGHSNESVQKWISDVTHYYDLIAIQ